MNTLTEVLPRLTVDQLKSLMRWLPDASPTGRKDLLVGAILRSLAGDGLRALWERLDDIQRMAVAETAYAPDGLFDGNRFRAKYGRLPDFTIKENGRGYSYYGPPTALGLFLYHQDGCYSLPDDMRGRLELLLLLLGCSPGLYQLGHLCPEFRRVRGTMLAHFGTSSSKG
jgi:hypothetical protein